MWPSHSLGGSRIDVEVGIQGMNLISSCYDFSLVLALGAQAELNSGQIKGNHKSREMWGE